MVVDILVDVGMVMGIHAVEKFGVDRFSFEDQV